MILHVDRAVYEGAYRIRIGFNDGAEGSVDLRNALYGPMFEPLLNKEAFRCFRVDPEVGTVVWENGADFAPEFLRDRLLVKA